MIWLEHLLVLSMLQYSSGTWSWGRYVVIYPSGNSDFANLSARYRSLPRGQTSFGAMTVDELLDAGVIPAQTAGDLRGRYLPK